MEVKCKAMSCNGAKLLNFIYELTAPDLEVKYQERDLGVVVVEASMKTSIQRSVGVKKATIGLEVWGKGDSN